MCVQVYAGVDSISQFRPVLYWMNPSIQLCHRRTERNYSGHYTDSEVISQLPTSFSVEYLTENCIGVCLWCGVVRH